MREYRFWQVDAFTRVPFRGNPAAVVFDADTLSDDEMQRIARQMNLSETTFLLESRSEEADYVVRIFTPRSEIPFAGHPTIAAAHAHVQTNDRTGAGQERALRQRCGIGTVSIEVAEDDGAQLFMIQMPEASARSTYVDRNLVARMLNCKPEEVEGVPVEVCSTGLPWMIASISSLGALSAAVPDQELIEQVCRQERATGLTVYSQDATLPGCSVHLRTFAPGEGILEDPICGSCNGATAVHLSRHAFRSRKSFSYRAEQGLEIHREGIIHVSAEGNGTAFPRIQVGGNAVTVMEGTLRI